MGAKGVARTISRADVAQNCPFSDFAGMIRLLTVASGTAMILKGPDEMFEAKPWEPVRFDGGLKVCARLEDGPLTDLNRMFDPTACEGEVTPRTELA